MAMTSDSKKKSLWYKLGHRPLFLRGKLSTRNLDRLCRENATDKLTLVVHSEDVKYKPFFPNAFTVTKRLKKPADLHVGLYYEELSTIASASYEVIVCTGLLEHIPDPQRLVDELYRILTPGGRLIISASAVFSFHEGPNNFFHFTPFGFKVLFKNWSGFDSLRGSSQPFETIGILMQRILMQSWVAPPIRPIAELLALTIPFLDRFVGKQYDSAWEQSTDHEIDSMLPSNIQAVVIK
jgi:SAM-dependent methyltransferase